jgi:hypothetical protein
MAMNGRPGSVEQLVIPPWEPGTYTLTVTAVQAKVGWFDAARSDNAFEATVQVDRLSA